MEQTIGKIARELAWVVGNAIIDSRDGELGSMPLTSLIKIREIVEHETSSLLKDMTEKSKEVRDLLDRI